MRTGLDSSVSWKYRSRSTWKWKGHFRLGIHIQQFKLSLHLNFNQAITWTFCDTSAIWIESSLRHNNIDNLKSIWTCVTENLSDVSVNSHIDSLPSSTRMFYQKQMSYSLEEPILSIVRKIQPACQYSLAASKLAIMMKKICNECVIDGLADVFFMSR